MPNLFEKNKIVLLYLTQGVLSKGSVFLLQGASEKIGFPTSNICRGFEEHVISRLDRAAQDGAPEQLKKFACSWRYLLDWLDLL